MARKPSREKDVKMKTINVSFTPEEHTKLNLARGEEEWHDFILRLIPMSEKQPASHPLLKKTSKLITFR